MSEILNPSRAAAVSGVVADGGSQRSLDRLAVGGVASIVAVAGDDEISRRLHAMGVWPGARIERLARAPFGGPILFRVHGYRLALRRAEASRVVVTECR